MGDNFVYRICNVIDQGLKEGYPNEDIARAALRAIRDPTDAMLSAMNWNGNDALVMWRAAIDEALKI